MKYTCCFEPRFYRAWILLVVLLAIGLPAQVGVASKESSVEYPYQISSLLRTSSENYRISSFRFTSALGTQTLPTEQNGMPSVKGRQEPMNLEPMKSPTKAFLYSALVPGAGQLYIGAKRGYLQIAAEVGLLAAYFITRGSAQSLRKDYRQHVRKHVVPEGPTKFDDWDPIEDFEHATLFDNWRNIYMMEGNGEPLERVGKWYWEDRRAFKDEERKNHDSPLREVALQMRMDANDKFQLAKTFLGIALLNHVVSAVDARIAAKSYNKKHGSLGLDLQTTLSPYGVQSQLVLQKRF